MKVFAGDKLNFTQTLNLSLIRLKNIVGKGETSGSPFPTMFAKVFSSGGQMLSLCVNLSTHKFCFDDPDEKGFLKRYGKRKEAGNHV